MSETVDQFPRFPMSRSADCPFDPPPELLRLQRECPVAKVRLWDESTAWLVTGYAEQRQVLADSGISSDPFRRGYPHSSAAIKARRLSSRVLNLLTMDNPEHDALRRKLMPPFTVKRVEALRPRVQQLVDRLLDELVAKAPPADLVEEFAMPIPSLVICELLGMPYEDHEFFQQCASTMVNRAESPDEALAATNALRAYVAKLIALKRADPGDDLTTHVVGLADDGTLAGKEQAVEVIVHLLFAGLEAVANMIATGTLLMLQHPKQLAEVRDSSDPRVVANAVEEMLRYLSILHAGRRRVAATDMTVGGYLIRAGEGIIAATDAGNRDAAAFERPDVFDIHRQASHHVAFAFGIHQCLGQALARIELQTAFPTLLRRLPNMRLAIPFNDVKFKHDQASYGVEALPVTWDEKEAQ